MADLSKYSWYHGKIERPQTEAILSGKSPGTFLVRDSKTVVGGFVLAVSENGKVSHYIINFNGSLYQIGEQTFHTLPEIIEFYKKHLLDKTTLKEPVPKPEELRALFNFDGKDFEDLPFRRGDVLTLVKRVEENWWRARNSQGKEGMIPKTYVQLISPNDHSQTLPGLPSNPGTNGRHSNPDSIDRPSTLQPNLQNDGCDYAIAIMDHLKPYDESLLSFKTGERIKIVKKNLDGSWFGEDKNGKTGTFPFTYIRLVNRDGVNGV